jgi:hypothetical protein
MATSAKQFKTLTSFSGSDLVVTFNGRAIAELQQISWAIQREKAPIFTLGDPDPRSFSRGKRGIAGSLVFAVFDRDALIEELRAVWNQISPVAMFTAQGNLSNQKATDFQAALSLAQWNVATSTAAQTGQPGSDGTYATDPTTGEIVGGGYDLNSSYTPSPNKVNVPAGFGVIQGPNILYADMLPPFDATMTFANEYGNAAFQKIYDLDVLNESSGVSVDSIVMERQLTYVCRRISPIISGVYQSDTQGMAVYSGT